MKTNFKEYIKYAFTCLILLGNIVVSYGQHDWQYYQNGFNTNLPNLRLNEDGTDNTVFRMGGISDGAIINYFTDTNRFVLRNLGGDFIDLGYDDYTKGTRVTGRLLVHSNAGPASGGVEFNAKNKTQGIGFGYNTIYTTGTNPNQNLGLKSRGTGNVDIDAQNGILRVKSKNSYPASGLAEFKHSNGSQGIGFGYNTIYATGTNTNQVLGLKSRGSGNVIIDSNTGMLEVKSANALPDGQLAKFSHTDGTQGIGIGSNTIYTTGTNQNINLELKSKGNGSLILGSPTGRIMFMNGNANGNGVMTVAPNGYVGIGTASPNKQLEVNGDTDIYGDLVIKNVLANRKEVTIGMRADYVSDQLNLVYKIENGGERKIGFTDESSSWLTYSKWNDKSFNIPAGALKVGIDKFEVSATKLHSHIEDVTLNYGGATDLTKFSLNTDAKVVGATATISGAVYIGAEADKINTPSTPTKFKPEYLTKYNLWVEDGIVTEDLAFADVSEWKDEVFKENYNLITLEEVKAFIAKNKHLPEVPSEKEVKENGYSVQKMNVIFLQKIEELTLYTIEMNEKVKQLEEEITSLKNNKKQ